jgi:hypothetical protein
MPPLSLLAGGLAKRLYPLTLTGRNYGLGMVVREVLQT